MKSIFALALLSTFAIPAFASLPAVTLFDDSGVPVTCAQTPAHPNCLKKDGTLTVRIAPEDYERLKGMSRQYGKFYASLNILIIQEQIQNERLFHAITKWADADIKALSQTLANVKVAVETQEMLDQRQGNGGVQVAVETQDQLDQRFGLVPPYPPPAKIVLVK